MRVGHIVQLYSVESDVTLSVFVTNELKADGKNSGYLEIGGHSDPKKNCFWDGLQFFIDNDNKEDFTIECGKELRDKNYDIQEIRKHIKVLIKKAFKLKILV